ncbi:MAG: hypothetical protein EXR77_16735 [Myxococcales bacterium]|nr:hypothetical protein [Myxococcales bacterium]
MHQRFGFWIFCLCTVASSCSDPAAKPATSAATTADAKGDAVQAASDGQTADASTDAATAQAGSADAVDAADTGDSAGASDGGDSLGDGPTDAVVPIDAANEGAGPTDAGPTDAGPTDAGPTDAGAACSPGQKTCASPTTVQYCNSDGVFETVVCGSAQVCLDGKCKLQLCAPNATVCDAGKVATCNATGTQLVATKDCAAAAQVCENAQCLAKLCDGGAKQCDGQVAQVCSPAGTSWLKVSDCKEQNAVCKSGACVPIPCADGGFGCQGNAIVKCDGSSWASVQDCSQSTQVCLAGKCQKTLCLTGVYDCVGGLYTTCEAPGLSWSLPLNCPIGTTCAWGIGCLPAPAICQPGDSGCDGSQPVVCDAAGTATPTGSDCAKADQVCSGGGCKAKLCAAGTLGCLDNHAVACNDAGSDWLDIEDCSAKICNKGKCLPKVCGQGQTACSGASLALCDGSWQVTTCSVAGQKCSNGGCTTPQCALQATVGPVLVVGSLPFAPLSTACDLNDDKKPDAALGALSQLNQGQASAQTALGKVRVLQLAGLQGAAGADALMALLLPALVSATVAWDQCPGAECKVSVEPDAFELQSGAATCPAKTVLSGGTFDPTTGKLSVGGGGNVAYVPLQTGVLAIEIPLFGARLVGSVGLVGGAPQSFSGVLCGSVPQEVLFGALSQIPDAAFANSKLDKGGFAKLLTALAPADLDLDGDGIKESISAAFTVVTGPASCLGMAK